ncbi:tRNA (adenosine(37)-N6)-threonylcarbamoyltransferase complex transferase subunit TsaD [Spirochaetia bacterium 38H-sp]|uniref:tRNA N6-adenosine threonylcarbamoyltransferase n=1 Tax=Rarispira pelagica TaxID=3141764 RepID=A0ABU9UDA7_9SPIR
MIVVGIESSCDECSVAVVKDGRSVLSNVIATQIEFHKPYSGVVPEIASRKHVEWIMDVYNRALKEAGISSCDIDVVAATNRPGLMGSLVVGFSFAKGLAMGLEKPLVAVDHIKAHLYAPHLEYDISYPFIGLLLSGGHTVISMVNSFDDFEVMGTTIDDACGEAFDKVAKHFGWGYPGGVVIDRMAEKGCDTAFSFPDSVLKKDKHTYDVSYSGIKTAVVYQLEQFKNPGYESSPENIAASFRKAAIDMVLKRLDRAVNDTGIKRVVLGGGVAANSYLRRVLTEKKHEGWEVFFPSMELCTDNGAMVAAIAYEYAIRGRFDSLESGVSARVPDFKPYSSK